jgi:hypothetical protein
MKDKSGKEITMSEFLSRWKSGIKQVIKSPSPLEKISLELQSSYIIMAGFLLSFIALLVFRDSFGWVSYGILVVFLGNIISQFFKISGLRTQYKIFKELESQFKSDEQEVTLDKYIKVEGGKDE